MDLTFSIDLDAGEVHGVVDNSIVFTVIKDDDDFVFKNFDRIDDEQVQEKLRAICEILLTIDEY